MDSPTLSSHRDSSTDADEVLLLRVANVLLRHRWLIVGTVVVVVIVAVLPALLQSGRTYAATATFMAESDTRRQPNLSGIAAQFGFDLGGTSGANSPQFYADLLESPHILRQTVVTRFDFSTDTGRVSGTLVDLLTEPTQPADVRRELAAQRLADATRVTVDARTGVITLEVSSGYRELAAPIAQRMLDLLQAFNIATRRSRAIAERQFLESRLSQARQEQLAAERELQDFLQRNRDYHRSPALSFAQERLAREASLRQQLYSTLAQSYEQTRIEEVRDTPVLTVLDPPLTPVIPEPRGRLKRAMLAAIIGLILGILLALLTEFAQRMRQNVGGDAREFSRLLNEFVADIRRPWRRLRRRVPTER